MPRAAEAVQEAVFVTILITKVIFDVLRFHATLAL